MKDIISFFLVLTVIVCTGCTSVTSEAQKKSTPDSLTSADSLIDGNSAGVDSQVTLKDSPENADSLSNQNYQVTVGTKKGTDNWTTDDYIVQATKAQTKELKQYIEYVKADWKNAPNPVIATYIGNDFGDYFHLEFEDATGKTYDFGNGENDFGNISLYSDDEQMTDNPNYLGKSFKVFWEWKISSFPCCSGEYDQVKAYMPSIVKLELMKNDIKKK